MPKKVIEMVQGADGVFYPSGSVRLKPERPQKGQKRQGVPKVRRQEKPSRTTPQCGTQGIFALKPTQQARQASQNPLNEVIEGFLSGMSMVEQLLRMVK